MSMSKIKLVHIPYKSGARRFIDVQAGHTPMMFGNIMNSLQHVRNQRVRARAWDNEFEARQRCARISGNCGDFARLSGYNLYGVLAPAGTRARSSPGCTPHS